MSEFTADGRPVGLYAVLPDGGEPAFVHAKVPPGAAVLDLSHAGGRFANGLTGLGHEVVVVDDSPAMLAQVRHGRTVQADLATLDLGERFPVVLAATTRVNAADVTLRDELLAACRRHVTPDGLVVLRWLPPSWFDTAVRFTGRLGPLEVTFEIESFDGTVLDGHNTYRRGGTTWELRNSVRRLSNADMRAALLATGLRFDRHLRGGRQFFSAVPVSGPPGA
ncbi:class I SAM-dependent methyltransferase [Dactylosporangium sp. CA-152071]|uniref:class I SAM-dependent methyltransferase n=1 Tax=Dactylosporangium sp. CA-152071 TaxID=3239933 RepID=UPI003D90605E